MSQIKLETMPNLPKPTERLPWDRLYIQLGCVVCPHQVCIRANNVSSMEPENSRFPAETRDLMDIVSVVEHKGFVQQNHLAANIDACEDPKMCPEGTNIPIALNLLAEEFDSNIPSYLVRLKS